MRAPRLNLLLGEMRESFHMAMGAIASHKLRSCLTLLGVLVGVFSIIVVVTAMRVMQSDIEQQISRLGSQTFMIQKRPAIYFGGPEGYEKYFRRKDITYPQARLVAERATLPLTVGIESMFWGGQMETRWASSAPNVQLFGETSGSFPARGWVLAEGRLLMEVDVDSARDVCVLGGKLAGTLFPFGSAIGERLKINGINYTVVGVLESQGGKLGGNQDNFAILPLTTGLNRFGRWNRSLSILVQARDAAAYEETVEQVRGLLRVIRKVPPGKEDDFEIFSNDSMISQFNAFTLTVRLGVSVVSSIALLAAGIGIMNIMLVSVTERTREIGIRRAVGAKKRAIMTQFIMEAIVLCQVGGVIGVGLGVLGGNLTAYFLKLPPVIPVDWMLIGFVICSVVGVVFGSYPAYKAANLDPIESLRYE
jgi:putative ABC transport system permease protein